MTETLLAVYILVGDINATVESHVAVDNENFSMVTIILYSRKHRTERIENKAFYPLVGKLFLISERQCELRSHAVIKKSYLHACLSFFKKYLNYLTPHFAVVDNKILHKDKLLSFLKLLKHSLILIFAKRKISDLRITADRVAPRLIHIVCKLIKIRLTFMEIAHYLFICFKKRSCIGGFLSIKVSDLSC